MATYQITSSAGVLMGLYEGATADEALEAMFEDGQGDPLLKEQSPKLFVEEVDVPTQRQILALREEAAQAGDLDMVKLCERATDRLDHKAIVACIKAIRDARAMDEVSS